MVFFFGNTVKGLVNDCPKDWEEVSELEYLEQENDMNLSKQLDHLQQELDEQYKLLSELKKQVENEELKEGVWYKLIDGNSLTRYKDRGSGVGFDNDGNWCEAVSMTDAKQWKEATEDEIEQALVKEYKRRGGRVGALIKQYDHCGSSRVTGEPYFENGKLLVETDDMGELWVFTPLKDQGDYGSWAKIIEQTNKIYDYTVEGCGSNLYKVGCETLDKGFLQELATLTKKHDIKIELEGHDVTKDIQNLNL